MEFDLIMFLYRRLSSKQRDLGSIEDDGSKRLAKLFEKSGYSSLTIDRRAVIKRWEIRRATDAIIVIVLDNISSLKYALETILFEGFAFECSSYLYSTCRLYISSKNVRETVYFAYLRWF